MPLHVRSIATSIAVICFFGIAIISGISGIMPFTCCKRAIIGAVIGYIISIYAVKMINAILINAMIKSQMNQGKEQASANEE